MRQDSRGTTWAPRNSDGQGSGSMSVERATRFSVNTAFATMQSQLNLCDIAALADRVGFVPAKPGTTTVPRMSMVLGTQETSPLSMASAYATFANEGMHCTPIAILSVTKADGSTITPPAANCSPELSTATTNAVNYSLEQVLTDGGAKKSRLAEPHSRGQDRHHQRQQATPGSSATPARCRPPSGWVTRSRSARSQARRSTARSTGTCTARTSLRRPGSASWTRSSAGTLTSR